jgi:serpin B
MNHRIALVSALAGLLLAACGDDADTGDHVTIRSPLARQMSPDVAPDERSRIAAGNQDLAFELYRQTAEPGENYVASPLSIQQAFALVYAGARGETATEIANVLHFEGDSSTFHATMNAFDLALTSRNMAADPTTEPPQRAVELRVANAFWGQEDFEWKEPYLDLLAVNYGAGIEALDFISDLEGSRRIINAWVEDRTEDRIRDLIPAGSLSGITRTVLTNAIYFNAPWSTPFSLGATQDAPFTLSDGTTVTAQMMRRTVYGNYAGTDEWQALELPFRGEQLSMLVIVPAPDSFDDFDASLSGARLREIVNAIQVANVDFALPRFAFETELDLSDELQAMGMATAFAIEEADLSGMLDEPRLWLTDVFHKAFISVDETGVEAAAATAIGGSGVLSVPTPMRADRPFYFAIRDRETELVIFWGRVMDPTQ